MAILLIGLGALVFFAEVLVSASRGRPLHKWKDTFVGMSMQATTGFVSHFGKLFLLLMYVPLHDQFALWEWKGTGLEWVLAFLAYEFSGYWFHRVSHETNLGWAVHVVHHQSEEMNLATAIRTAPLRSLFDWPFLLPLAILGIPPHALIALYVLHAAGQYWLHVQWISRLGPLEWVLNTPSHHRVHHGCQPRYQDANYGASLIIWDRLFGTFVQEEEAAHYGITRPATGWDPARSIWEPFAQVVGDSEGWSFRDRLLVWAKPPGWYPGLKEVIRGDPPPQKTDTRPSDLPASLMYSIETSLLFLAVPGIPHKSVADFGLLILFAFWALRLQGLCLDDRPIAPREQIIRIACLFLGVMAVGNMVQWLFVGLVFLSLVRLLLRPTPEAISSRVR